jgi:hypothetical protein
MRDRFEIAVRLLSNDFAIAAQRLRVERSNRCAIATWSIFDRTAIVSQSLRNRLKIALNRNAFAARSLWNRCAITEQWLCKRCAVIARRAQHLRNRCAILLQSYRNGFEIDVQSLRHCCGIALVSNRRAITSQTLLNYCAIAVKLLASLCNRCEIACIALQSLWNCLHRSAIAVKSLASLCNRCEIACIALQSLCNGYAVAVQLPCYRFVSLSISPLTNHNFSLVASHHITSHHITSHHITSHHITSHRVTGIAVDIRTDSGYVLLAHADPGVVQRDYERILELQAEILLIDEES